jgi:hypothetical protein
LLINPIFIPKQHPIKLITPAGDTSAEITAQSELCVSVKFKSLLMCAERGHSVPRSIAGVSAGQRRFQPFANRDKVATVAPKRCDQPSVGF